MVGEEKLLQLAREQRGMLSMRQCLEAGWSRGKVAGRVKSCRLIPVARGVYRLPGAPDSWESRVMAGCLRAGAPSAAWGPTAASIWGFEGFTARRIIIATTRNIEPFGDVEFKRVSRLNTAQVARIRELSVTSAPRTLLDVAGCCSPRVVDAAIDSALLKGVTTLDELTGYIDKEARQGVVGIQRLRDRLECRSNTGLKRSFLETDFATFIRDFQLPLPRTNFLLMFEDGFTAEVDAFWAERDLVVEVQSEFHLGMAAMTRDAERVLELESRGLTVVQVTAEMIRRQPGVLARRLRTLLDGAPKNQ